MGKTWAEMTPAEREAYHERLRTETPPRQYERALEQLSIGNEDRALIYALLEVADLLTDIRDALRQVKHEQG